ncbi:hypothetical protein [Streptomyces uncialis]|uniref:hypothetical protein n=1 Tax=Streptomyces uncialis TaxID=1048205 RepID=UPI00386EA1AE|nr:hypothetical protein OG268_18070 [Streptomyces uncialis]
MHHHGYTWIGEKTAFDNEALRRPPHPHPPPPPLPADPAAQRLTERYREVVTAFTTTELPPIQTAHWLLKPSTLVHGTWTQPEEAVEWLRQQLAEPPHGLNTNTDPASWETASVERLSWGGDISLGHYLGGTLFRSLAVVTCSPNRAAPELRCPLA